MSKQNILVMFGGISPEHEVSVITGLQVLEKIDREKFNPLAIYIDQEGLLHYYPGLKTRKDFVKGKAQLVLLAQDRKGAYLKPQAPLGAKQYIQSAYLAFHGGIGESGHIPGMLESLNIPFTSSDITGAMLAQNKVLTKMVLKDAGLPVVEGVGVFSKEVLADREKVQREVVDDLGLPVIVKPAHLGSSIGVKVAHDETELGKALLEAAHMDSEVLVEKLLTNFVEYNISVRGVEGKLEVSEIEKPIKQDEILSFADKYQRGAKKTGAGMASLSRELPANISMTLKDKLVEYAKKAYIACRLTGVVRIDFMSTGEKNNYITEINSIPGSMAFYLWEAKGESFTEQITKAIEESIRDQEERVSKRLKYESDIIEKFVAG